MPHSDGPGIRIVRFTDSLLREGIETHAIEGVPVRIFGGPSQWRVAPDFAAKWPYPLRSKGYKRR